MRRIALLMSVLLLTALGLNARAGDWLPIQPGHWGAHYDPWFNGEGLTVEFHDDGARGVVFIALYLLSPDGTPLWLTVNESVPAPVIDFSPEPPGGPLQPRAYYTFTLLLSRSNNSPVPVGELIVGVVQQEVFHVIIHAPTITTTRIWATVQLTRPPGIAGWVTCPTGGFSPPHPVHRYCLSDDD